MKVIVIQTRDISDVMLSTALCNTLKLNQPDATVDMLTMNYCTGAVEAIPTSTTSSCSNAASAVNPATSSTSCWISARVATTSSSMRWGQLTGFLICLYSRFSRRIG